MNFQSLSVNFCTYWRHLVTLLVEYTKVFNSFPCLMARFLVVYSATSSLFPLSCRPIVEATGRRKTPAVAIALWSCRRSVQWHRKLLQTKCDFTKLHLNQYIYLSQELWSTEGRMEMDFCTLSRIFNFLRLWHISSSSPEPLIHMVTLWHLKRPGNPGDEDGDIPSNQGLTQVQYRDTFPL